MNLSHGGHLTHGHPLNFSGLSYKVADYGVSRETETIDYDELQRIAERERPKLIVCGASAYPRIIDFERIGEIARSVGARMFADIAHIAGLVVAGLHPSPVPHADYVTTTTHKTLRGPRAGLILCKEEHAKEIDRKLFPGMTAYVSIPVAVQQMIEDHRLHRSLRRLLQLLLVASFVRTFRIDIRVESDPFAVR